MSSGATVESAVGVVVEEDEDEAVAWWWWRALRRFVTVAARVVLPEPGMPEMAIMRRLEDGSCWYFARYVHSL